MQPSFEFEKKYENLLVAGIDESGRGTLAGPVVAACAIIKQEEFFRKFSSEINDSKKISKVKRGKIFDEIKRAEKSGIIKFGIGIVGAEIIDKINILQATKLAMQKSLENLHKKHKIFPKIILVDGNFNPFNETLNQVLSKVETIIKGDQKSISIAAASIIAKETRDKIMDEIHEEFSQFGFNKNAGYGTKFHFEKIREYGICKFHRKSFEPIKSMLRC